MLRVTTPSSVSASRAPLRGLSSALPSLQHAPLRRVQCAFKTERAQEEELRRKLADLDEALPPITAPITGLRTATEALAREKIWDADEWTLSRQERATRAFQRIKARWDLIEDKKTFIGLAVGTIGTLWLSSQLLNAVDNVPLIPDFFTFVGLVSSGAFFWKYVLFYEGRETFRRGISRAYHAARDVLENQDLPWDKPSPTRSPSLHQTKDYTRTGESSIPTDRLQSHVTPGGAPTAPVPRTKTGGGDDSRAIDMEM